MSGARAWRAPGESFGQGLRGAIVPPDPRLRDAAPGRFPLVDAIRAIAAMMIFAYHVTTKFGWTGHWAEFQLSLASGVPIFFVISGFLLYRPFALAHLSGKAGPRLGRYARSRVLRIVPAYWVVLTVVILLGDQAISGGDLPYLYGFAQVYKEHTSLLGVGQAWSLDCEVVYYLMIPVVALTIRRLAPARTERLGFEVAGLLVLFAASAAMLHAAVTGPITSGVFYLRPTWNLDLFVLGMALAVWSARSEFKGRTDWLARCVIRRPGLWCLAALAAFGSIVLLRATTNGEPWAVVGVNLLGGLAGVCILLPAIWGSAQSGWVRRSVLSHPWFLGLGVISYGVYLWHLPIIGHVFDQKARLHSLPDVAADGLLTLVSLALALIAAAASWVVVERVALSFKGGRRVTERTV